MQLLVAAPHAVILAIFPVFGTSKCRAAWAVVVVARCPLENQRSLISEDEIKTTFTDVAGCDEAKDDVAELVEF